jgi:predicted transposase YbfD/YdcC
MAATPLTASFLAHFSEVPDPRTGSHCLHQLTDLLFLVVCATPSGADDFVAIAAFGRERLDWLRRHAPFVHRIPSHDTLDRICRLLPPDAFQTCFLRWVRALGLPVADRVVALDGKVARRSADATTGQQALGLVTAWASELRLVLGQLPVAEKSNEITAIPELLRLLDLEGAVVTADALNCQREIAAGIRAAGADYVLAVKGNQGRLYDDVLACVAAALEQDAACDGAGLRWHDEAETGHGRSERRTCLVIHDPEGIRDLGAWADLAVVCMVLSERTVHGVTTHAARYYIGSRRGSAADYAGWVRSHWGVENGCHWVLDIAFADDQSRARRGYAQQNLGLARRWALSLLRQDQSLRGGVATKRLKLAWNTGHLARVLNLN